MVPCPLTADQLASFHREGYLVVDALFSDDDLQPVIDELAAEVDARAQRLHADGELADLFEHEPFDRRLTKITAQTPKLAESIWDGTLHGPGVFNLIRHPKLLDVAEQLCGPELIGSSVYRIRPKVPNHRNGAVPWHQDSGYFDAYCDKALILTVWMPLVDATEDNGCLWVIPRSHRDGIVPHVRFHDRGYLAIDEPYMPTTAESVCVPVAKGGVLLLTNLTAHASFENRTELVRWSLDLRYQSALLPTNAPITRLPEEVAADEHAPPACYPPEADFLIRSPSRPGEVIADPDAFAALRASHVATAPGPGHSRWGFADKTA